MNFYSFFIKKCALNLNYIKKSYNNRMKSDLNMNKLKLNRLIKNKFYLKNM